MKTLATLCATAFLALGSIAASAQDLIDKGFVSGWNVMVDPSFGNGCLIQTVYQDLSVVRIGYDATGNRGYFVVFHKGWGKIEKGKQYDITFDLDGQKYNAVATGFVQDRVPGAGVFFDDRDFVHAIAQKKIMTVYNAAGQQVISIDLKGSAKALDYARKCQEVEG
ncbi:hypothetical protein [Microbulbifer sp. S227A]|uniref:hypothetical protein n=1 Tax=Microbulbifer sp. S227A TaxID=3415131 RepID=UPI003C7A49B5